MSDLSCVCVAASLRSVPANAVLYECNRTSIHLVVRMDPWGTGLVLSPEFLHLGSCPVSLENSRQGILEFQYSLKECGFVRMVSSWVGGTGPAPRLR